ncbi:chymotrypsin family serine protease [Natronococcus jeotgali]|uniref:Uncharacterized protein n=1 Tax=Natronococcus jeotgali DSM 18795 TaxID=1227498 RepID=L9WPI3_9EURY|nr:hypothetical protein [Natronococcus jeotgali]ELY51106.1 hypothetical protein C492_21210 [Natronococcus jeotgali DSM 18795]
MPTTQDFEYLLECRNVIGVDYDEDEREVRVFVSQKLPPDALADEDDVEKRVREVDDVDVTVDVVDAGYDEEREGFDALSTLEAVSEAAAGRSDRRRPVPAGASEANANLTAGTGGPYPARVTGDGDALWDEVIEPNDLVRLSNNHVYARSNAADLGESILQPSPHDGGGPDDEVGELVGYVPVEDGVRVDVAARSVDPERESDRYAELDEAWPTGVRRDGYGELRGETVTKTGRTTGVTSATVEATSASVAVEFGAERGTVTLRDQLIAGYLSEGGDSGSPVFLEDGELVGLLFAGSAQQTICNRIGNVERELGVEILLEEPGEDDAVDDGGDDEDGDDAGDERDAPVYTTTFATDLEVALEGPTLELESLTFDERPRPGTTVAATVVVAADGAGEYWLEVGGERRTFELEGDERERAVAVEIPIPDDSETTATVSLRGGVLE